MSGMQTLASRVNQVVDAEQATAKDFRQQLTEAAGELRAGLRQIEKEPETQAVMRWLREKSFAFSLQPGTVGKGGEYFEAHPSIEGRVRGELPRIQHQSIPGRAVDCVQNVTNLVLELTPDKIQLSRFSSDEYLNLTKRERVFPSAPLSDEVLTQLVANGGTTESTRNLIRSLGSAIASGSLENNPELSSRLWSLDNKGMIFGLVGRPRPGVGCS